MAIRKRNPQYILVGGIGENTLRKLRHLQIEWNMPSQGATVCTIINLALEALAKREHK